MSSVIYITNKKTGAQYAYESFSFRDPISKKPRTRRTYLGRVNPLTGKIVPKAEKGKRNRSKFDEVTTDEQMNPHSETGSDESLAKQISLLSSRVDQLALKMNDLLHFQNDVTIFINRLKGSLDSIES